MTLLEKTLDQYKTFWCLKANFGGIRSPFAIKKKSEMGCLLVRGLLSEGLFIRINMLSLRLDHFGLILMPLHQLSPIKNATLVSFWGFNNKRTAQHKKQSFSIKQMVKRETITFTLWLVVQLKSNILRILIKVLIRLHGCAG